jgi:hypothetical protein
VNGRLPPPLQFLFAEADVLHPHLQVLLFFHHDHEIVSSSALLLIVPAVEKRL